MTHSQSDPFKLLHRKYRDTKCGHFARSLNKDNHLVDLNNLDQCDALVREIDFELNQEAFNDEKHAKFKELFKELDDWKFYTLNNAPNGLILIPNVFKDHYAQELFDRLLYELPTKHFEHLKSNINSISDFKKIQESNLRWFTFGYHYDWTNKIYLKNDHNKTPELLGDLLECLKALLKLDLELEAGIVNYYTCKSKLNAHSDCREENLKPPLLSISLGEKALFLVGEKRYEEPVTPIVLRNGDLMIMADQSRLAYHSIVKIVCDDCKCKRKVIKRININVRQVY